jgi:hypothetical protein
MTLSDEVVMTDSGNDSESSSVNNAFLATTPSAMDANATNASGASSPASSSGIVPTMSATGRLAKLLAREQELIKTLEQLTQDIAALEKTPEDEAKEESQEGEEEGDDLEEFEAPEWCVPIKANVMTYDWDVRLGICHGYILFSGDNDESDTLLNGCSCFIMLKTESCC